MGSRKSQTLDERLVDGFLQYEYTETWQVTATGIAASLLDADLPQIGQPYLITGVSTPVYCYSRRPTRRSDTQAKTTFDVVCTFTNATQRYDRTVDGQPAADPEQIVPRVDIAFEEYTQQTNYAKNGLIGIFDISVPPTLFDPAFSLPPPPKLTKSGAEPPQFGIGKTITNSAGDPFENVTVRNHTKRVTYWTWHRDWDSNWDNWMNVVNNAVTTVTQSDKDGQRLKYTFDQYTLMINDIIKEDHWRDGRLYFRRGIVMSHKPDTWFSVFVDKGFNELIWQGQLEKDGTVITDAKMDSWFGSNHTEYEAMPVAIYRPATDTDARDEFAGLVAPAEPMLLNGYGRVVGIPTPNDEGYPKHIVYMTYNVGDYSQIGIS